MRLIDAEHLYNEVEKLKESPWFNENINGSRIIRREALNIVEDLCICKAPTVCDIEQIRTDIRQKMSVKPKYFNQHDESDYDRGLFTALNIIDKYTKGESE